MKFYTLNNELIGKTVFRNFTGIIEYLSGARHWFLNEKRHRIDGPAIEWHDGTKEWWINNIKVSEEQYKLYINIMKLKKLI